LISLIRAFAGKIFNEKSKYIYISLFTSFISILKSYLLMKIFPVFEVGILSFVQSIIMFIGFTQLGLLNGGYRIISKSATQLYRINNYIFSYIIYLLFTSLLIIVTFNSLVSSYFDLFILLYAVFAAYVGVFSNWLANLLIADQKVAMLNKVNILSLVFSFLSLAIYPISSLWSGILFVTSQSIALVIFCLKYSGYKFSIRPLDKRTGFYILKVGFVPYILNILGTAYILLERWMISADLGIKSLGIYYLVFAYTTFYQIIPAALNNLEFPAAIRVYNKNTSGMQIVKGMNFYFIKLLSYTVLTGFFTYFVAEAIVLNFIPQYLGAIPLIKIIYWGLASVTLVQPLMVVFQVKLEYNKLIGVYICSSIFILLCFWFFSFKRDTSLMTYASLNLLNNLFIASLTLATFYYFSIIKNKKTV
jgi:O-antigen/teichoic acid export membrane protein